MSSRNTLEVLVDGLRSAHAIEMRALELLERQAERLVDFPEVQHQARRHAHETRGQIRRLEECLDSLGEEPSAIRDATLSLAGNIVASVHASARDEILTQTFANYAFEHYEIAVYRALIVLADEEGLAGTVDLLRSSLREEERMANWIGKHIEDVTRLYLAWEERHAA
jgi:ferritin-like metal-binding protein YciE